MPDLMTHVAVAHLMRRAGERFSGRELGDRTAALLYVGAVLPDIPARVPMLLFNSPDIYWASAVMHSPLALVLLCIAFAATLGGDDMWRHAGVLALGSASHVLLDLLQRSVGQGAYLWLFPVSWSRFQLPLYWPSETVKAVPWLLGLVLLVEVLRLKRDRPS